MVRHVALVVAAGLLASCAALAGIDGPTASDPSADGGGADPGDARPSVDAAVAVDASPVLPTTASITVRCGGTALSQHACSDKRWEYDFTPCAGQNPKKVVLENSGIFPIAFVERGYWIAGVAYVPNQPTDGSSGEMVGVIGSSEKADISAAYNGGIFVLVGSVRPFDAASVTARQRDEGKVACNAAMLGSFPTNDELFVAELTATTAGGSRCTGNIIVFNNRSPLDARGRGPSRRPLSERAKLAVHGQAAPFGRAIALPLPCAHHAGYAAGRDFPAYGDFDAGSQYG